MKRITAALTALAVVIGLGTSCQKEMESRQEISGNGTGLKVTATIADNGTKMSYQEDNTNHSLQPGWEVGDILIGFDSNDESKTYESKTYGYQVTEVSTSGVATLAIITNGDYMGTSASDPAEGTTMYMFYAPGTKPSAISDKSLTVSIASQAKDTVPTLMMAQATVTNGSLSLSFNNKTAIIGVKAPVMADKDKEYTSLSLSGSTGLNTAVTFSLDGDKNLKASYQTPGTLTKTLDFTSDSEMGKGPDVIYIVACPAETQNLSFKFNGTEEYFNVNGVAILESNYYRLEAPNTAKQKFTVTVAEDITGGTITTDPSGSVAWGETVTVTATPATGYELESITVKDADGGDVNVTDGKFTMPAKAVTVTVTFKKKVYSFTVGSSTKVVFAPGNLYAKRSSSSVSDWTWDFYDEQYQFHSESMKKINASGDTRNAASTDTEIDLFCWGYDSTNSTNPVISAGIGGHNTNDGNYNFNTGEDWGSITGLRDAPGATWRTLSKEEWTYLLNTRSSSTVNGTPNARYLKCKVNDGTRYVYGLMIFPDTFTWPTEAGDAPKTGINNANLQWGNVSGYTTVQFSALEGAGVVFLPAAGDRYGNYVRSVGASGNYSSSTANGSSNAYYLLFGGGNVSPAGSNSRSLGWSVRLVSVVQ